MDWLVLDAHFLSALLQIILIDLLLSGDNAMVIALACRSLPPRQARFAMLCGTGVAIGLRVVLTAAAALVMSVAGLKLVGAAALLVIAIKLLLGEDEPDSDRVASGHTLRAAITMIVIADAAMSLDNVVAVAAASHGNLFLLIFGLLLSIPLLMAGSVLIGRLIQAVPLLVAFGAALLGWIAGSIAVADPLVAEWIGQFRPSLKPVAPVVGALFVVLYGWHMRRRPDLDQASVAVWQRFCHKIGLIGHGRWIAAAAVLVLWVSGEVW